MTEIEKPLLAVMLQRRPTPADPQAAKYFRERNPLDPEIERVNEEALQKPLATLNQHLETHDYLLGKDFTLADLNVASVMMWANPAKLDLSKYPHVLPWLARCLGRPAAKG